MGAVQPGLGAGQVTLHPNDFDPSGFARGKTHRIFTSFDDGLGFPILLACGGRPGPTLVVTANVHGDEYEAVRSMS
jgi:predicted deacylase